MLDTASGEIDITPGGVGGTAMERIMSPHHSPSVVCGTGPRGSRPHNRRSSRHRGIKQPRHILAAAVEYNSSVRFKRLFKPVSS